MHSIRNRPSRGLQIAAALFSLAVFASAARSDIFQWEYIDAADPSQGRRQSTTLASDGAGVEAVPGADFSQRKLTMAYLRGANLSNANGIYADLMDAELGDANLTAANFHGATLTGANLAGAEIRGVDFRIILDLSFPFLAAENARIPILGDYIIWGTGITLDQVYSTASYQAHDLRDIGLANHSFSNADFTDQNLAKANFSVAGLAVDFSRANLSGANFSGAYVGGSDFTDADVRGASFNRGYCSSLCFGLSEGSGMPLALLYSTASYKAHDLRGIDLTNNDLAGADFAGQNLGGAKFNIADLTNADFTGADVKGASFAEIVHTFHAGDIGRGRISLAQLYSTASYLARDLSGIKFYGQRFAGGDFRGQVLAGADFELATLTNADFTGADVKGSNFFATTLDVAVFRAADLTSADFSYATLSDADFRNAVLTNANFGGASLTNATFTDADVRGAVFYIESWQETGIGITAAQLYSTASYRAKDLSGITLQDIDLSGANLAGHNLTNAFLGTTLTSADFTAADARGAFIFNQSILAEVITGNLIHQNGHISGLDLLDGGLLVVRDYDGDLRYDYDPIRPPIPITVDEHLTMSPNGTLQMVFEADAWDSTISFAPGIPVALGGTLELTFAAAVDLAEQVGRTFNVFDWSGVDPTGVFAISSPYSWDLSNLFTTGEVTLTAVPEPSVLVLVSIGLISLAATRRTTFTPRAVAKNELTKSRSADLSSLPTQIQSLELIRLNSCQGDCYGVAHNS